MPVGRELPPLEQGTSQPALVRWIRGGKSLIMEAVFTRTPSDMVAVRLYKQSPSPLFEMRLSNHGDVTFQGPMAPRGRSTPTQLAGWKSFLLAYQQASSLPEGNQELHTAQFRAAYEKSGKILKVLSISSQDTGETITARFRN